SGVKGMNVSGKIGSEQNRVLAMDVAKDDAELFVVTENGYGKRTSVAEYPVKGRGTKGVLTAKLTEKKGGLAGALIVREHQDLLFISENGMVQRTNAGGISQMGRATQGVRVMNLREDDRVSAVALVVESSASVADEASAVAEEGVNLALTDLPGSSIDGLSAELRTRGVEVEHAPADLADRDERRRLASWAAEALGPIDILVNNAGVEFGGPYLETSSEELELTVAVNLLAVMDMTRLLIPGMLE